MLPEGVQVLHLDYFLMFNPAGAILKGFDHESEMSPYARGGKVWPGVLDGVPEEFGRFFTEPAFSLADTTFCIWRRYTDPSWKAGAVSYPWGDEDADGSAWMLLPILAGDPADYQDFAEGYYGREVDAEAVSHIYQHRPLTEEVVRRLNGKKTLGGLRGDIEEIGYAIGAT